MIPVPPLVVTKARSPAVGRELRLHVHPGAVDDGARRAAGDVDGVDAGGVRRQESRRRRRGVGDLAAVGRPRQAVDVAIGGRDSAWAGAAPSTDCTHSRVRGGRLPAARGHGGSRGAVASSETRAGVPSGAHSYALTPSGACVSARAGAAGWRRPRTPAGDRRPSPRNETRVPSGDHRRRGAGSAGTNTLASSASRIAVAARRGHDEDPGLVGVGRQRRRRHRIGDAIAGRGDLDVVDRRQRHEVVDRHETPRAGGLRSSLHRREPAGQDDQRYRRSDTQPPAGHQAPILPQPDSDSYRLSRGGHDSARKVQAAAPAVFSRGRVWPSDRVWPAVISAARARGSPPAGRTDRSRRPAARRRRSSRAR